MRPIYRFGTLGILTCVLISMSPLSGLSAINVAELKRDDPVDFQSELLPVLRKKCLACHNTTDAESDVVLESPQTIAAGGASGPLVVAGDPDSSMLMNLAAHRDEPIMPPEDNEAGAENLTPQELALLELWIRQGATGEVKSAGKIEWQPLPNGLNPIYAVTQSRDGRYVVAGRANQIWIHDSIRKQYVGSLVDPALNDSPMAKNGPIAHLDLVQALAISPDGRRIASGGYRTVKLWRNVAAVPTLTSLGTHEIKQAAQHQGAVFLLTKAGHLLFAENGNTKTVDIEGSVDVFAVGGDRLAVARGVELVVTDLAGSVLAKAETPGTIRSLAWHATSILVGFEDGAIRRFDQDASETTWKAADLQFKSHSAAVTAISVGAESFVAGDASGEVRIYEPAKPDPVRTFKHPGPIAHLAVTADRVVTVGGDHPAHLWNKDDAKLISKLEGNRALTWRLDHSKLKMEIAKRHVDNVTRDLDEAKKRVTTEEENLKKTVAARDKAKQEHEKAAQEAAAADEAKRVAEATVNKSQERVKAAEDALASAEGDEQKKQAAAELEAAKKALKAANDDVNKKKKDAEAKQKSVTTKAQTFESAKRSVTAAEKTVAGAKRRVVELEPQIKLRQDEHAASKSAFEDAQKQIAQYPALATSVCIVGGEVFVGGRNGSVGHYLADTGQSVDLHATSCDKSLVAVFAVGREIQGVSVEASLVTVSTSASWQLERIVGSPTDSPFSDRVTALAFHHDGKQLAVGGGEPSRAGELMLLDVDSGELIREITDAHSDTVFGLAFSPDGKQLASCGADRFMKLFDLETGKLVRTFEGHTHHVLCVGWRADGRALATGGADKVVKVWNTVDGSQLKTIQGFGKEIVALQFAGSSDQFFAACGDQNLYRCNVGGERKSVGRGTDFLYSVSLSATGDSIAFAGHDSVVRLLDGAGKLLLELKPQSETAP